MALKVSITPPAPAAPALPSTPCLMRGKRTGAIYLITEYAPWCVNDTAVAIGDKPTTFPPTAPLRPGQRVTGMATEDLEEFRGSVTLTNEE